MAGLIALVFGYVLSQFYRSFLAVMTPALINDLGATNIDLARASGMWFFTFALMQFAVGVGLDRFGPRRTTSWMLGVAGGGGIFLFAGAQSPLMIVIAMGLIGVGCAPVLMASLYIFVNRYTPARFAFLTSVVVGIGNVGNIVSASPMALANETFGWRAVVAAIGVFTVIVAIAIAVFVKDPERPDKHINSGFSGFIELLRMRVLWPIIPIMLVAYSVAAGIRGLWLGPFLADVYGGDALLIGKVSLYMAIAMTAGTFLYGPLDTIFNTRKWVVVGGIFLVIAALCYATVNPLVGVVQLTIAFVIIGAAASTYGVIMAHGKSYLPKHLAGRGVTLLNFFSIGGASLMQIISGYVTELSADANAPQVMYQNLFGFYAIVLIIAIAIYLFSHNAKPKEA